MRFLHKLLSKLSKKLCIGGEDFICHAFKIFAHSSGSFQFANVRNDFLLLLARKLPDLLDDFICTHNNKLTIFTVSGKLCAQTTSQQIYRANITKRPFIYAIFGVSFGAGLEGRDGVSASGW